MLVKDVEETIRNLQADSVILEAACRTTEWESFVEKIIEHILKNDYVFNAFSP